MAGELSRRKAPEGSLAGSWWGEENMRARLEVGHDCKEDMLVMNITPPTFKLLISLLAMVIVILTSLKIANYLKF